MSGDVWKSFLLKGLVDIGNSTSTPLGIGGVFPGSSINITNIGAIFVNVYADQASATNGLKIYQSSNGTNWDHCDEYTVPIGGAKNYAINPFANYLKVEYTNGGIAQGAFRLQTVLKTSSAIPSSHRIQDPIVDEDDARLVKSVLTAKFNGGAFGNIAATESGNLRVANAEDGLAIASGDVVGRSFIHKFGKAPDFDAGDGTVTIWDGANDGLLGGGAMRYTYSTTADIDTISSSSVADTMDVEVWGLDTNLETLIQTVTLTGQVDATLTTPLKRVFRMINRGNTDMAGVIYLRTNGSAQALGVPTVANTVRAIINNGNNQTLMSIYTIPSDKNGFMRDWYAALAGASKTSEYEVKLFARPLSEVFQLKHDSAINETGTSSYQHKYSEPEPFDPGTDIELTVEALAAGVTQASISGGFDIVLEDT